MTDDLWKQKKKTCDSYKGYTKVQKDNMKKNLNFEATNLLFQRYKGKQY